MTTQEFLDRYDNKEGFSSEELENLYWGDCEVEYTLIEDSTGEHYRWVHEESKIVKINDRYFELFAYIANTEYQDNEFDCPPIEVKPVEKTITVWEAID